MKTLPPVVYVAGPFRGPALSETHPISRNSWAMERNVRRAETLAHTLWGMGASVICPHCNTRFFQNSYPDEVWLQGDLAQLARCDAVVLTSDWFMSEGAKAEKKFAEERGIPIFCEDNLDPFIAWLEGWIHRWPVSKKVKRDER